MQKRSDLYIFPQVKVMASLWVLVLMVLIVGIDDRSEPKSSAGFVTTEEI